MGEGETGGDIEKKKPSSIELGGNQSSGEDVGSRKKE